MLDKVRREIIRIQRQFLWFGLKEGKGVNWISWKIVCKPKSKGGLGVKDISIFNKALLRKWIWRILNDKEAIWSDMIQLRYGNLIRSMWLDENKHHPSKQSLWCRDLNAIGLNMKSFNIDKTGIRHIAKFKLGNGYSTPFWKGISFGSNPLEEIFPLLYCHTANTKAMVSGMGDWLQRSWH
ncbi:unnamed protein product [Lathyrus sativus]|nr:unnamed protein product [Lathyrus sativus]